MPIQLTTRLVPIPSIPTPAPPAPPAGARGRLQAVVAPSPLGHLAVLPGAWTGHGFNQIFRPQNPGLDNFLELNLTDETLEITEIPGEIPNRGMVQPDISVFGMTYLQQVADANVKDTQGNPAGIHIEPGIWLNVPATTEPDEPASVARLANIPHGTSLLAQGLAADVAGVPVFPPVDITPFPIGDPGNRIPFPSQNLSQPSPDRSPAANIVGITQGMLDNPNSVLQDALVGKTITSHTRIDISTAPIPGGPTVGGGIADIAFLVGAGQPNAQVASMDATFWVSSCTDGEGNVGTLLQYSQVVLLNFNGISWPHVSVANLTLQAAEVLVPDLGAAGPAAPAPAYDEAP